jgi:dolichol-phosphate mannosyltransferase
MLIPDVQNEKSRLSIVVPMCNEEESIALLSEKLLRLHESVSSRYEVEYCLVDDGSTDRTRSLMAAVAPPDARCVCLHHEHNRGLGAAIRTGLNEAFGVIVCTIDADCSYPPEKLCELIEMVESGHADIAVASPYHPQGAVIGVKPWRLILSRQCSALYRLVSPLKLYTYTSIFRAYSRAAAKEVKSKSDGFVSAVEILLCAQRKGYRVSEVPMVLYARQHGYSKIRIATTIGAHLAVLWNAARTSLVATFARREPVFVRMPVSMDSPARINSAFTAMEKDQTTS